MNKERVRQWIDTLRSGEYPQGRNRLRDNLGGFCCLGVLCDLYIKAKEPGKWENNYFVTPGPYGDLIADSLPPFPVGDWIGISKLNIKVPMDLVKKVMGDAFITRYQELIGIEVLTVEIAALNDNGASFNQIADILEQVLLREEDEQQG